MGNHDIINKNDKVRHYEILERMIKLYKDIHTGCDKIYEKYVKYNFLTALSITSITEDAREEVTKLRDLYWEFMNYYNIINTMYDYTDPIFCIAYEIKKYILVDNLLYCWCNYLQINL